MRQFLIMLGIVTVVISGLAYKLHTMNIESLKIKWVAEKDKAVAVVKAEVQKVCDENNLTTKENARALQLKYDTTLGRYNRLLAYKPTRESVSNPTSAPRGRNEASGAELSTLHITLSDWANIAKRSDDQASQFITLQDLVADIYRRNGQENLLPEEYRLKR